jgi:hypothetical protein
MARKRVEGTKSHIVVDITGILIAATIRAADVQDRATLRGSATPHKLAAPVIGHI